MGEITRFFKKYFLKKYKRAMGKNENTKYLCLRTMDAYHSFNYQRKYAKKYEIDEKLIIFESFMGRQYSCSPRMLYEELRDNPAYADYKKVWAFKKPGKFKYLTEDPNTEVVLYGGAKYCAACAQAKVWVTNSRLKNHVKPKEGQYVIQTWHGTPLKRLGFDIDNYCGSKVAQKQLEYNYSTDVQKYSYMLSPSDFYKEKITSAFNLKKYGKENIFIDGEYPRNTFLNRLTEEQIKDIKRRLWIPEGKRIILYAPTWRETSHKPGKGYQYELAVDFDKWREVLGDDTVVLYRSHYFISNYINLNKYAGFVKNVSTYNDINELYAISDVLITDYSSVFFDYANLKRPMLFFMYDYEEYKNELRGFYLSEDELPGPIVKEEDELLKILKDYNGEGYEEKYEAFNKKYNPYRDGNGAKVVWERVFKDHPASAETKTE